MFLKEGSSAHQGFDLFDQKKKNCKNVLWNIITN